MLPLTKVQLCVKDTFIAVIVTFTLHKARHIKSNIRRMELRVGGGRWRLKRRVPGMAPSTYPGQNVKTNERVIIKLEPLAEKNPKLAHEYKVYDLLSTSSLSSRNSQSLGRLHMAQTTNLTKLRVRNLDVLRFGELKCRSCNWHKDTLEHLKITFPR